MEFILGSISLFGFAHAIDGWLPCDGRLLQIQQHVALFSLLGTQYGGDGQHTFALPQLSAPLPGTSYQIVTNGIYPARS